MNVNETVNTSMEIICAICIFAEIAEFFPSVSPSFAELQKDTFPQNSEVCFGYSFITLKVFFNL